ncbi:CopG domain-containing protein [Croceicoccus naphthovorans]|uniref:CopG domain-containing protein n=1 Tax=Croceicoccus naphthovorans TaxID=1348774 RepID=A0A0G3XK10_9SPHN|nr:CopG domain-containing protein [Croceicoccus naphthovorans]AKM11910.1 CopG domain-containing protein [Croceicoccus naphthovorans]MBB3989498.1 putative transcriptional regulator [Croceicoccus naphthovorans]UBS34629.1 CopG family transcriptional regulator [Altererythrobacter sp. N1]
MRVKRTYRLPPDLADQIEDYAARKRVPQTQIIEAALLSFLSPDGPERLEAALARRLDRLSRQLDRLEQNITISNEAIALFVRFWLTTTPPLPDTALGAAKSSGNERYKGFIEALGRRVETGSSLAREISRDVDSQARGPATGFED